MTCWVHTSSPAAWATARPLEDWRAGDAGGVDGAGDASAGIAVKRRSSQLNGLNTRLHDVSTVVGQQQAPSNSMPTQEVAVTPRHSPCNSSSDVQ